MSVISKPIFHFVGWYFEQLFNHPLRTKAVTRFVGNLKVNLIAEWNPFNDNIIAFPAALSHHPPVMYPRRCPTSPMWSRAPSYLTDYSGTPETVYFVCLSGIHETYLFQINIRRPDAPLLLHIPGAHFRRGHEVQAIHSVRHGAIAVRPRVPGSVSVHFGSLRGKRPQWCGEEFT